MRSRKPFNLASAARLELFARQHRTALTESEGRLWATLKARQLGVSFRRQVPVGGQFIADFLAPSIGLIVEVDGAYHARRRRADERRELKLRRFGFRVIRVSAELVLTDIAAAVELVRAAL
jgi:very-short-patch-repair endonuclease